MDPNAESRMAKNLVYPSIVYLEATILFFGANFFYHQNIFRNNGMYPFPDTFWLLSFSTQLNTLATFKMKLNTLTSTVATFINIRR